MADLTDEQRLAYARELANNPLLRETLDIMQSACVETFMTTGAQQTEERERAYWLSQGVQELDSRIKNLITQLTENSDVE